MRYFIVTYHQTPLGKYNETIKVDNKIRNKYLNTASVIIDYKDRKIIKSRFQGELGDEVDSKDFATINNFYKTHYTQVISQLEAKYEVLTAATEMASTIINDDVPAEIVEGVEAELKAEVAAAVEAKTEDGSD